MARSSSGGTPAVQAVDRAGVAHRVHPYEHDPRAGSYGVEAAEALGVDPARVFKTLLADADGRLVVGIVPVSTRLDLKALARAVGARRAARRAHPTVLDSSALGHDTVLVSAGRRGLDVELAPSDLVALTSATTAPIATA
jgi:Cys-tRNA(Pro)/Cys-tRNA(Cys) deacylase